MKALTRAATRGRVDGIVQVETPPSFSFLLSSGIV
jgi:hypothetical protein